jgi:ATP-dependent helicase IRC3
MKLYSYQEDAIVAIKKNGNRQYIEMPTGSGKTITFLSYAKENHYKILIIVPSKQLLNQVYQSSLLFWDKDNISRKGDHHDEIIKDVHICIINSLKKSYLESINKDYFDLVIIDEAHHSQSHSYKRVINYFSEKTKILGFTATPDRSDGLMLKDILHKCSFKLEIYDLIHEKHLSDIEGFSLRTNIDITDISDNNGDFSINQLYTKLCTKSRNQMIVDVYKKEMLGRKTMIFCINIQHSKEINNMINSLGICSNHIDGNMPPSLKENILKSFREGQISVLCNCQLLTEGFDEPSVDGIIIARPTRSRSLFIQMIGRGLRKFPGKKNCKIIDIVDNHRNLSGLNSLITEQKLPQIERFNNIREISDHIVKEMIKITEYHIERANLFNNNIMDKLEVTESMIDFLEKNNIVFFNPISFEDASFLIWFHELNKEYSHGKN